MQDFIAPRNIDTGAQGGPAPLSAAEQDELAQLRAERAARAAAPAPAAAAPAAAPAGAVVLTEDRLAQIIAQAVAQGRRDAALAGGARPEKPEEIHSHEDGAQFAIEGLCDHPLSAHLFFGQDGYGACQVDGCKCSGRELGKDAVTKATRQAKADAAKAEAPKQAVAA